MDITVTGGSELRRLSKGLKAAGSEGAGLRKALRGAIVAQLKPMQSAVRQAALALPSSDAEKYSGDFYQAGPPLRQSIAKAVDYRITVNGSVCAARLQINPSKMPAGQGNLPAYMDGHGKWRHPLFGDYRHWQDQASHPFFDQAIAPHVAAAEAAVAAAVIRVLGSIERI